MAEEHVMGAAFTGFAFPIGTKVYHRTHNQGDDHPPFVVVAQALVRGLSGYDRRYYCEQYQPYADPRIVSVEVTEASLVAAEESP